MQLRRFLAAARLALRSAPLAPLLSALLVCAVALASPAAVSAKPFLSFPAGWSLAALVGAREAPRREAGLKPYTGRRVANDTLRMVYHHDQTAAVVELGPGKLLLNCELIETIDEEDSRKLLLQLSRINRPYEVTFKQMIKLMNQCQQVEGIREEERPVTSHAWTDQAGAGGEARAGSGARARLDAGGAGVGLLGGSPLTLLQGIIPGTKWCGTGDIAADYHDLGADRRLDRCCRAHDLCPTKVRAFSSRYNLTNNSIYSKSHCTCDDMLFDCLKTTNTSAAHLMGHIYFNIVQVPCLADSPRGRKFRDARYGF